MAEFKEVVTKLYSIVGNNNAMTFEYEDLPDVYITLGFTDKAQEEDKEDYEKSIADGFNEELIRKAERDKFEASLMQ